MQDGFLIQERVTPLLYVLGQCSTCKEIKSKLIDIMMHPFLCKCARFTWCILHGYHEGFVLQEVLIVLDDVGVVEEFQDLALVLRCQALIARHLLHRDFLQDDKGTIVAPSAQMHNAVERE